MILITITNRHVPAPRNDLSFRPRHLVFAWPRLPHQVVIGDDEEGIGNDDSDDDDGHQYDDLENLSLPGVVLRVLP